MKPDLQSLNDFIVRRFSLDPAELTPTTPLFSSGLLDSFHLIELITQVEAESGIRISPGEVSLDNLDTTERILRFVEGKRRS
jgi:acyl carrier protein